MTQPPRPFARFFLAHGARASWRCHFEQGQFHTHTGEGEFTNSQEAERDLKTIFYPD